MVKLTSDPLQTGPLLDAVTGIAAGLFKVMVDEVPVQLFASVAVMV